MIREMMCLLALAGVMAGCTNDGSSELQRPETTIRLTAELQQGSRTVLGDDGLKVLWENQDRLGVFSDKGDANVSFLLSEGAGESVGRFEGALSKGAVPQYVYYPYSADAGTSTATLAVTVDGNRHKTVRRHRSAPMISRSVPTMPRRSVFRFATSCLCWLLRSMI